MTSLQLQIVEAEKRAFAVRAAICVGSCKRTLCCDNFTSTKIGDTFVVQIELCSDKTVSHFFSDKHSAAAHKKKKKKEEKKSWLQAFMPQVALKAAASSAIWFCHSKLLLVFWQLGNYCRRTKVGACSCKSAAAANVRSAATNLCSWDSRTCGSNRQRYRTTYESKQYVLTGILAQWGGDWQDQARCHSYWASSGRREHRTCWWRHLHPAPASCWRDGWPPGVQLVVSDHPLTTSCFTLPGQLSSSWSRRIQCHWRRVSATVSGWGIPSSCTFTFLFWVGTVNYPIDGFDVDALDRM